MTYSRVGDSCAESVFVSSYCHGHSDVFVWQKHPKVSFFFNVYVDNTLTSYRLGTLLTELFLE